MSKFLQSVPWGVPSSLLSSRPVADGEPVNAAVTNRLPGTNATNLSYIHSLIQSFNDLSGQYLWRMPMASDVTDILFKDDGDMVRRRPVAALVAVLFVCSGFIAIGLHIERAAHAITRCDAIHYRIAATGMTDERDRLLGDLQQVQGFLDERSAKLSALRSEYVDLMVKHRALEAEKTALEQKYSALEETEIFQQAQVLSQIMRMGPKQYVLEVNAFEPVTFQEVVLHASLEGMSGNLDRQNGRNLASALMSVLQPEPVVPIPYAPVIPLSPP